MIQRMFVTLDTKKTNYKNVGKINHGDDLILEITVLSDGDMISFNDPMVDLLVKKSDGKMIRQNSGIEHIQPNKFIIEVKKDCVTSPGLATNQLVINDNGRISTCMFYYTILNSLEEDIIQSISSVEVLEQLDEYVIEAQERMELLNNDINELEELFGATSDKLVEAENARNEAEQKRAQSEILRVNNENNRIEADNIRNQNEVDRSSSELVREQRESERILNEEERHQNESERMIDESTRQQNENARQSNESIRMSNEIDRKTQENRRVTAETNRVNAETTRRNNENIRISNESERQKTMNEMKSLLEDARGFNDRVGVVEDEIEEINSSLDNMASDIEELKQGNIEIDLADYAKKSDLEVKADKSYVDSAIESVDVSSQLTNYATKTELGNKVDKIDGKGLSTNDYTTVEKNKLSGLTNYTHPTSHSATMITEDSTHRFVTDSEKSSWNNKSNLALGTTSTTAFRGDYGNTAYTHSQSTHAPSNAQKNSDITKAEIEAKLTGNVASHTHSQYLTEHQDLSLYAKTTELTLGVHADGLIYLFKGGQPLGSGVEIGVSGDVVGYVDSSKNIVLKGSLADGDYTVKYEMNDGTLYDIGVIKLSAITYTNLFIPSSAILNKRVNSSFELTDAVGKFVTSSIDVKDKTPFTSSTKIYIKGATFTPDGNTKITTYKTTGTTYNDAYSGVNGSSIVTTDMGNGVICVDFALNPTLVSSFSSDVVRFIMVLQASTTTITASDIEDVVITINEPI